MEHRTSKVVRRVLAEEGVPLRSGRGAKASPPAPRARFVEMAASGMSSAEIGASLGCSDETARRWMVRFGVDRLPAKSRPERNAFWAGGRTRDRDGYVLVKWSSHPSSTASGYVREHRLVMESVVGRLLTRSEVVDHVNGIVDDNRAENLKLYPSNADHLRATLTGRPKRSRRRRRFAPGGPTPTASETGADLSRQSHPLGPWIHGTTAPALS